MEATYASYNPFMNTNRLLLFLLLLLQTLATPLTQQQVEAFVVQNHLVPPSATLRNYYEEQGKSFVLYSDQFSTFKFAISQDQQGKPFVAFRQQMTEFKFSNNQLQSPSQANPIVSPSLFIQPLGQMPIIPVPEQPKFGHEIIFGNSVVHPPKHRRRMPCRINEQEIETLLKQNLMIFKNAEIKSVQKGGFERGNGMLLQIILNNEGKDYKVQAGYMPRWRKLNVMKVQQVGILQKPFQIPAKTNSVELEKKSQNPNPSVITQNSINFETLLQSFVEKLLVRKELQIQRDLPESQNTGERNSPPVELIKQSGESFENLNPERISQVKGSGKQENRNSFQFSQKMEPKQKPSGAEKGDHHLEQSSEQISELVTEVLSKIKLKSK